MPEKTRDGYTLCAIKGAPKAGRKRRPRRAWHLSPDGFRELRHSCFLTPKACAEFLGVSLRTVRHWDAGRCRVPWSVVRLLRLHRLGDVGALHDRWDGWMLNARTGELLSPNGYSFEPHRLATWTVVCEQARLWRLDYDRRASGGVGALAPARPQAVTLQPEVWQAEVITEALPSPTSEAVAPLNLLLGLAGLAWGQLEAATVQARQAPGRRASAGMAMDGLRPGEALQGLLRQLAGTPVADSCETGVRSATQDTPAGPVPPSFGATSQPLLDPGFPKPDKHLGGTRTVGNPHSGRDVQRSREAGSPLLDPTPTPEIRPTRSEVDPPASTSADCLGRRTARARKPARKGGAP